MKPITRYAERSAWMVVMSAIAVLMALVVASLLAPSTASAKATVEQVAEMIEGLSADANDYTADDLDYVEEILAAYEGLSAADQATIDTMYTHGGTTQPLGRVLESALWTVWSFAEPDNSTTLQDKKYTSKTTPALISEYSKGKSTSSRDRPWSVKEVEVQDGKAYATLAVASDSYSGVMMHGTVYPKTNTAGNCEFAGIPIDLNTTFYFNGVSESMPVPIAFSLTTSIDEEAEVVETDLDRVKALIAALPGDPFKVTVEHAAAIAATQEAFDALSAEDQAILCDTSNDDSILDRSQTYGRFLESAQWALDALNPVDNATKLKDGTYTVTDDQVKTSTNLGLSNSMRRLGFTVKSVFVRNGRAFALIEHSTDTSQFVKVGGIVYENLNVSGSGNSFYEIPIDLNSTMHLSVMGKNAKEGTAAIAYEMTTEADESAMKPDPKSSSDDGQSGGKDSSASSADQDGSSATTPGADSSAALTKEVTKLTKSVKSLVKRIEALLKVKAAKPSTSTSTPKKNTATAQTTRTTTASRTTVTSTAAKKTNASASETKKNASASDKESKSKSVDAAGQVEEGAGAVSEHLDELQEGMNTSAPLTQQDVSVLAGLAALIAALAGAGGFTAGYVRRENKVQMH